MDGIVRSATGDKLHEATAFEVAGIVWISRPRKPSWPAAFAAQTGRTHARKRTHPRKIVPAPLKRGAVHTCFVTSLLAVTRFSGDRSCCNKVIRSYPVCRFRNASVFSLNAAT